MKKTSLLLIFLFAAMFAQNGFAQRTKPFKRGHVKHSRPARIKGGSGGSDIGLLLGLNGGISGLIPVDAENTSASIHSAFGLTAEIPMSSQLSLKGILLINLPTDEGLQSTIIEGDSEEIDQETEFSMYNLNILVSPLLIGNNDSGFGWTPVEAGLDFAIYNSSIKQAGLSVLDDSEFSMGYLLGTSFQLVFGNSKISLNGRYRGPFSGDVKFNYFNLSLGYAIRL
jgi:hypothetical protein